LAILIDTGSKVFNQVVQQSGRPHGPYPPSILRSSRTPYLPHLDARAEVGGKVTNQLAEIHPRIGRVIEDDSSSQSSRYSTRVSFIGSPRSANLELAQTALASCSRCSGFSF
jgi:hypothetical protein